MYTSKSLNPKICKTGYTSIGSPYSQKSPKANREKGKQFITAKLKNGVKGYFEDVKYTNEKYLDSKNYRESQPDAARKNGFGSHDAIRRDEFAMQARQQQHREVIERENNFLAKTMDRSAVEGVEEPTEEEAAAKRAMWFQANVSSNLYDIGNTSTTPLCNKCSRETFFCIHRVAGAMDSHAHDNSGVAERRLGGESLSSNAYGSFMTSGAQTDKAAYGRQQSKNSIFADSKSLTPTAKQMSRTRKPKALNGSQHFSPSNHGRVHHMAEFHDKLHMSDQRYDSDKRI